MKIDQSVIIFSEIKRCQHPQFTQIVQKAKKKDLATTAIVGVGVVDASAHFQAWRMCAADATPDELLLEALDALTRKEVFARVRLLRDSSSAF